MEEREEDEGREAAKSAFCLEFAAYCEDESQHI